MGVSSLLEVTSPSENYQAKATDEPGTTNMG